MKYLGSQTQKNFKYKHTNVPELSGLGQATKRLCLSWTFFLQINCSLHDLKAQSFQIYIFHKLWTLYHQLQYFYCLFEISSSKHFFLNFTINKNIHLTSSTQCCPHMGPWIIDLICGGVIKGHGKYGPIKILPFRWPLPKQSHVTAVNALKF